MKIPFIDFCRFKGTVVINDGNHRVRFWREGNKKYIPAWCYDEKITEWNKINKNDNSQKIQNKPVEEREPYHSLDMHDGVGEDDGY